MGRFATIQINNLLLVVSRVCETTFNVFISSHFAIFPKMSLHHGDGTVDIADIEDCIIPDYERENSQVCAQTARVKIHRRIRKTEIEPVSPTIQTSIIPGTQTICVVTWGCAHNSSDSEYMAGQLSAYGYALTDRPEEADLWVLNSCTVKGPAEAHFRNMIEKGQKLGKHIVAAGCVPQGAPKTNYLKGLSVIGVHNIDRIVEVVEETIKGNSVRLFSKKMMNGKKIAKTDLELPKIRRNKYIEIIPINSGCLNECTYCKTKHARGRLRSYTVADIVTRAVQAFSEGVLELWLTSEDTGAYGRDIGTSLPQLLWEIIAVTPKNCRIRVGMTNPPYIMEHLEEIAKILNHEKVYSFLHVPVQSGSDSVLGEMKREYDVSEFKHVINFLRERVPGITIVTDIICGFPTETIEDFNETLNLCKELKFPSLHINQFYPRPGTVAASMRRIPAHEVKKRTKELSDWFETYFPYKEKLGQVQEILVTELASDNKHYVGHNKFYEQVLVPKSDDLMGKMILVKIIDTKKHCMIGDPLPVKMQLVHKFCLKPAIFIVYFFMWFLSIIFEFIKGSVQKLKIKEINS